MTKRIILAVSLQAARLSIARNNVDVEIDLTPEVSVAPIVFASIGRNHDGRVSVLEGADYAKQLFARLSYL